MCLHFSAKSPSPPQQIWPFFQTRLLSGSVNALFSVHSFDPPLCCVNNCVVFLSDAYLHMRDWGTICAYSGFNTLFFFNPLSCWQSKFPLVYAYTGWLLVCRRLYMFPFYKIHKVIRMPCICGGGAPSFSPCLRIVQKKWLPLFCVWCADTYCTLYQLLYTMFFALAQTLQKGPFCAWKKVKAISMRRGRRRTPPGGYDDGTVGNILSTSTTTTTTYKVKRQ